jgi:cytochrome c-type biogenesis protein CcmH/NrfG
MTGWLIFAGLAGVLFASALASRRLDRGTAMLLASALFAAAAGYAWQGSPGLPGAPARTERHGLGRDTPFASERQGLLDRFGETGQWLAFADGLNRMGEDEAAASALRGAIAKRPRDAGLRVGYAHALLVLADYRWTPAVALAFDQAIEIGGTDPAPRYFAGFAALETSDAATAGERWRALSVALPSTSPWRPMLAEKIRKLDRLRARAR